jgi:hypothetical protein
MFRIKKMKHRSYAAALLATGIAVAATVVGCWDEPTEPVQDGEEEILQPGLNAYLTLDRDDAPPGGRVRVAVKVRPLGVDLTPTGFQVDLQYDPEKLEPVAETRFGDGVLRAVNLIAGPGLVRAAGASANGLGSNPLFALDMKVKAPAYGETLTLDVREVTVLQDDFADASADIVPAARAVVLRH